MHTFNAQRLFLKKLEDAPAERNAERTKELRRDFANWLLNDGIQRNEPVYVDETGINLYCARTRGRAPAGQLAVRVVNGRRGRNITLCLAVSNIRGLSYHQMLEGEMDAETFQQFIRHVSTIVAEDAAFIFDNASAHRRSNERSQEILNGAQIIRMLPSYSLMLNIVENAIICLKAAPKRALERRKLVLIYWQQLTMSAR